MSETQNNSPSNSNMQPWAIPTCSHGMQSFLSTILNYPEDIVSVIWDSNFIFERNGRKGIVRLILFCSPPLRLRWLLKREKYSKKDVVY